MILPDNLHAAFDGGPTTADYSPCLGKLMMIMNVAGNLHAAWGPHATQIRSGPL